LRAERHNKKHPFLDHNKYHPILEDNRHPILDAHKYHPVLEDKKHPILDANKHPIWFTRTIHFCMIIAQISLVMCDMAFYDYRRQNYHDYDNYHDN